MIIIYLLFLLNILLIFIKTNQFKHILFFISLLYLSLYLINSNYSVDYRNYLEFWHKTNQTNFVNISLNGEFVFSFINKILTYITTSFAILPITVLLIAISSLYIFFNSYNKYSPVLLSTFSYPLLGYLSFHNYRQAIAVSFMLVFLCLIINSKKYPNKFKVFF